MGGSATRAFQMRPQSAVSNLCIGEHIMKKRNLSRMLCLSLVVVLFLLVFTGCMANTGAQAANEDGTLKLVETASLSEEVKMGLIDYVKLPFSYLLKWLYDLTGNYGLSLILFALIVQILLFYPTAKGKKGMMKMSRLTPRVKALEAKFGDDKTGYQQAVNQLYKDEGASGCGGCLWSLLPMLLLLPLFYIIREPITWLMFHGDASAKTVAEIQNIFITARNNAFLADPNSALANLNATSFYWQMEALPFVNAVKSELAAISPEIVSMNTRLLGVELSTVPHLMFWQYFTVNGVWNSIGQFLLPMLAGAFSLLSTWLGQKQNNTVIVNEKGEQDLEMAKKSQQNNMTMILMGPLFSLYIGFIAPAGLSLYWFVQSVVRTVQDYFLTKHYKKVYDAEDAVKQAKAAEEAKLEAERERLRAQRRAENPDGMIGSASKKKLQQREKNEQAAKEVAYLESQRTEEDREAEQEAKQQKLDGDRPYRRGRNYDPNRYKNNKE